MTSIANNTVVKVAAVVAGFVLAFSLAVPSAQAALTESQIQSILSLLQSFGADASTIANVNSSLRGTTPSAPSTPSTPSGSCFAFTRDLTMEVQGADVTALQAFLRAKGHFTHPTDTGYFGAVTRAAVVAWQSANGVTPAAGYFGAISRAKYNTMCGSTSGPVTPVPTGTGLAVSAPVQPTGSLAPENASRVPFTKVTVTAGNDGDVVINSFTVQRVGLGSNASFAGVVLLDDSGRQFGTSKTFNSNNQATIGEAVTIPRGTSKTFTVAGNMAAVLDTYAGEAPGISVIAVNTSATVTGSLPITGAFHITNATLTVGTLSLDVSNAFAGNSTVSKEIGTTAQRVSGVRLTAGSSEDARLRSIRFNQTGSVSSTDLANVMVTVGGTAYPAMVSSDGKYYEATLGSGIVIPKGNNVEIYVTYDIIGSNASGRTVIFDIDKTTDIYATGETYNYGISPSTSGGSSVPSSRGNTTETTGTPYIYANQITVTGAAITSIGKANSVAAQNIAVNVPNQPLGGFEVDIRGEAMTVQSLVVTVGTSSGSGSGVLTNVTIVDENGAVVAGPVDGSGAGTSLTFTDSITFPVGKHTYTIRGKVASGIGSNTIYTLTTNPSSQWTNVKGDVTGNTISLSSNTSFSMNAMTVKVGSLVLSRASSPASQTIVAGGSSVLFVNFQFDATQSGEDVRFSSVPVQLTAATNGAAVTDLTSCQLFDGATSLSTGSNVLNPSSSATSTLTLDNPVTATKGTVKTLGMRCNVSSSAPDTGTYTWAFGNAGTYTVSGATSGTTITPTSSNSNAVVVTIGNGSVTVTTGAGTPGYSVASAGSTAVTAGELKIRATNETVNLIRLGLTLTNTASSAASDLVKVSIFDGATQVGEAFFTGSNTTATSTLTTAVQLTKDTDKYLTLKVDLAEVGSGQPVTFSGHLVAVDFLAAETTGASSGTTIWATGSSAVSGVRVFKSFPVFAQGSLSTSGPADGKLIRFSVTADSKGPVGITEFNLNVATSTMTADAINIYGYTDSSYSLPISGVSGNGALEAQDSDATSAGNVEIAVQTSSGTATVIQIPAGQTRYFEARSNSLASVTSGASVTTKLLGDSSFPSTAAGVSANPLLAAGSLSSASLVWSPNSTTTAVRADQDWTNGFGVNGLPSGGMTQTRTQ